MFRFISIIFSIILTTNLIVTFPSWGVGVIDNHLSPCPESPNCVVSQGADSAHEIEPIGYQQDLSQAKETLLKVLAVVPRTEVIEQSDRYIHAISKSRIFGFIDDVEFYFPEDQSVIEIRSASRTGESDLGVNRRRMEQIRLAMQDLQA